MVTCAFSRRIYVIGSWCRFSFFDPLEKIERAEGALSLSVSLSRSKPLEQSDERKLVASF